MIHALHGNLNSPSMWSGLAQQSVHSPLLWKEVPPHSRNGFAVWAEKFCEEVGRLQDTPGILLGYSLGGRLALSALAARPDLWRAVVLCSVHPGLSRPHLRADRLASDLLWAEKLRRLPAEQFLAEWDAQPVFLSKEDGQSQSPAEERNALILDHRESIARAFEVWSLGCQPSAAEALSRARCPVVWVTGALDVKFTKLAADICLRFPDVCRHLVVPRMSHRPDISAISEILENIC